MFVQATEYIYLDLQTGNVYTIWIKYQSMWIKVGHNSTSNLPPAQVN